VKQITVKIHEGPWLGDVHREYGIRVFDDQGFPLDTYYGVSLPSILDEFDGFVKDYFEEET
jgi:hypothetical protein